MPCWTKCRLCTSLWLARCPKPLLTLRPYPSFLAEFIFPCLTQLVVSHWGSKNYNWGQPGRQSKRTSSHARSWMLLWTVWCNEGRILVEFLNVHDGPEYLWSFHPIEFSCPSFAGKGAWSRAPAVLQRLPPNQRPRLSRHLRQRQSPSPEPSRRLLKRSLHPRISMFSYFVFCTGCPVQWG